MGHDLGINFFNETLPLETLARLEALDHSSSISMKNPNKRRQALSCQGSHPMFTVFCKGRVRQASKRSRSARVSL